MLRGIDTTLELVGWSLAVFFVILLFAGPRVVAEDKPEASTAKSADNAPAATDNAPAAPNAAMASRRGAASGCRSTAVALTVRPYPPRRARATTSVPRSYVRALARTLRSAISTRTRAT